MELMIRIPGGDIDSLEVFDVKPGETLGVVVVDSDLEGLEKSDITVMETLDEEGCVCGSEKVMVRSTPSKVEYVLPMDERLRFTPLEEFRKFLCPGCNGVDLEEVIEDAIATSPVTTIKLAGGSLELEYGTPSLECSAGVRYQCAGCGMAVSTEALKEMLGGGDDE